MINKLQSLPLFILLAFVSVALARPLPPSIGLGGIGSYGSDLKNELDFPTENIPSLAHKVGDAISNALLGDIDTPANVQQAGKRGDAEPVDRNGVDGRALPGQGVERRADVLNLVNAKYIPISVLSEGNTSADKVQISQVNGATDVQHGHGGEPTDDELLAILGDLNEDLVV